jgi:hypothetical protein
LISPRISIGTILTKIKDQFHLDERGWKEAFPPATSYRQDYCPPSDLLTVLRALPEEWGREDEEIDREDRLVYLIAFPHLGLQTGLAPRTMIVSKESDIQSIVNSHSIGYFRSRAVPDLGRDMVSREMRQLVRNEVVLVP